MYILDPDRDGCTVWYISPNENENYITYIGGGCIEVIYELQAITINDMVYIDDSPFTQIYQNTFRDLGISLHIIPIKRIDRRCSSYIQDYWF